MKIKSPDTFSFSFQKLEIFETRSNQERPYGGLHILMHWEYLTVRICVLNPLIKSARSLIRISALHGTVNAFRWGMFNLGAGVL
jgi:hypothetical protein